jgi:OmcA/MtrC family decaheme c-type cytochrome
MNRSSARSPGARSRRSLFAVLALVAALGVAGCENDDGAAAGPDGPSGGDPGQTGPTGPTGPSDVPVTLGGDLKAIGNGSTLTAQQIADIGTLVATIDAASITDNKPVIEITVKTSHGGNVLGLAASTLRLGVAKLVPAANLTPSRWQSYINRAGSPTVTTPALASATQANTETGAAAGWTELGAGRYRYTASVNLASVTTPIAVSYEPTLTHRVSIALDLSGNARALAPDNPYVDFVPAGGTPASKRIAATEKCSNCHVRFAEHGGPRRDVEYCVVCHNPGTVDPDSGESVDMAYLAHSIHRGEARTNPYVVYGFGGEKFDWSEVTYPQPLSFCETCHEQSPDTPQGNDWQTTVSIAACGSCHDAGMTKTGPDPATGRYLYSYLHANTIVPPGFVFKDGECIGCHGAGGIGGETLAVHKRDAARKQIENGDLFTYEILNIENAVAGQSPKVTFRILDANDTPIDVKTLTTGRLRLDFSWSTKDLHNVADVAGNLYQANRGQAVVVDLIASMASVVANGDGTFSYTLSSPLPPAYADATLGSGLMVVLEGRRAMPDGTEAYPESAIRYSGTPRTSLVAQDKCEACHKRVAAHGGSRAGDPMVCAICHNSSVGGTWGTDQVGPLALGAFIHNVHAGNVEGVGAVTYPQSLARCEGCHVDGTFNLARTDALPLTVDAGTTASSGAETLAWQDDLADSATAGTCKGCHTSAEAITHMQTQGGSFARPKTLVPSSAQEGCATCHGAGATFETKALHCGVLPSGQCTN